MKHERHITLEQSAAIAKALRKTDDSLPLNQRVRDATDLSEAYRALSYEAQHEIRNRLPVIVPNATDEQIKWVEDFAREETNWHLNKKAVEFVIPLLQTLAEANLPFDHPEYKTHNPEPKVVQLKKDEPHHTPSGEGAKVLAAARKAKEDKPKSENKPHAIDEADGTDKF